MWIPGIQRRYVDTKLFESVEALHLNSRKYGSGLPESAAGRAGSSLVFGNTVSSELDMRYIDMSTLVASKRGPGDW